MLAAWGGLAEVPLRASSRSARVVAFGDSVAIQAPIAGRIAEVRVRVGDTVEAGAVLVVLDSTSVEQNLVHGRRDLELLRALVADVTTEIGTVESIASATREE